MADTFIPSYRRSARTDYRMWLLLVFGTVFFWAGSVIDPADNCSEDGECAPWLVPLAQGLGALVAAGAAMNMLANPNRGSFVEPVTGDLVWWQGRIGATGGDEGRIHPSRIGKIRIVRQDDSDDAVHLYNLKTSGCSGSTRRSSPGLMNAGPGDWPRPGRILRSRSSIDPP